MSLPALVLLPGMMCDARMYAPQIEALKDIAECQVGYLGGADNIADIAKQVLLNAPEKFALAGLSMGGIVAMEVARQAPQRVTRLALMDTNPWVEEDDVKATRNRQIYAAEAGQLEQLLRETMVPRYLANPYSLLTELCVQMGLTLGKDVFIRQSIALRERVDQKNTLRSYKGPALVLCGRHDVLCPLERHELMHTLLENSKLKIIENAGHLPTLEQPKITTMALASWLEDT